jgi:hypothetical protein
MYTVEFDHDEITITIIDDSGIHEDVIVNSFDDIVFIRQWDEDAKKIEAVAMSPGQWEELIAAINSPEGAFITSKGKSHG